MHRMYVVLFASLMEVSKLVCPKKSCCLQMVMGSRPSCSGLARIIRGNKQVNSILSNLCLPLLVAMVRLTGPYGFCSLEFIIDPGPCFASLFDVMSCVVDFILTLGSMLVLFSNDDLRCTTSVLCCTRLLFSIILYM